VPLLLQMLMMLPPSQPRGAEVVVPASAVDASVQPPPAARADGSGSSSRSTGSAEQYAPASAGAAATMPDDGGAASSDEGDTATAAPAALSSDGAAAAAAAAADDTAQSGTLASTHCGWGGSFEYLGVWPTADDLGWVHPQQLQRHLDASAAAECERECAALLVHAPAEEQQPQQDEAAQDWHAPQQSALEGQQQQHQQHGVETRDAWQDGSTAGSTMAAAAATPPAAAAAAEAAGYDSGDDERWSCSAMLSTLMFDSAEPVLGSDAHLEQCDALLQQLAAASRHGTQAPHLARSTQPRAAAAAAAVAELPPLQWPPHMRLATAIQYGAMRMQAAHDALAKAAASTEAAAAVMSSSSRSSSTSSSAGGEQPFAWMYSSSSSNQAAGGQGAVAISSSTPGLAYVLEQLAAAEHPDAWAFLRTPQPAPQQMQEAAAQAAHVTAPQQQQEQQQEQQHQALQSASWARKLWQGLACTQVSGGGSPVSTAADAQPHAAGSSPVHATQQQAVAAATADGVVVQLLPVQQEGSLHERGVLQRVQAMARGTDLEPLLWSVLTQQHVVLSPDGSALQQAGQRGRRPLSRPDRVARAAALSSTPQPQQPRQQGQPRPAAFGASILPHTSSFAGDWFASVAAAAFLAVKHVGQLAVSPMLVPAGHGAAEPAPAASNGGPEAAAVCDGAASTASSSGGGAPSGEAVWTLSLTAEPPGKPGWDPVAGAVWGGCFSAQPAPWEAQPHRRQQAAAQQHQHRQLLQQETTQLAQVQSARQAASAAAAAPGYVQAAVASTHRLQELHGAFAAYSHVCDRHPNLPAAFVARFKQLLSAAQPALLRSQHAAPAVPLVDLAATLAAVQQGGAPVQEAGSSTGDEPGAAAGPLSDRQAACELFGSLVAWFSADRRAPYSLLRVLEQQQLLQQPGQRQAGHTGSTSVPQQAPDRSEQMVQLLTLCIGHGLHQRPVAASLVPLLTHLQQHPPQPALMLLVCQQLLSRETGLQQQPAEEQAAAFGCMHSMVPRMPSGALLQLMQLLAQQGHLQGRASLAAAQLYRAAVSAAAQRATSLQGKAAAAQFDGCALLLVQAAADACVGAASLIHEAAAGGHVLPGHTHLEALAAPLGTPRSNVQGFVHQLQTSFLDRVQAWPTAAANSPAVAAEVRAAVARGQLQCIAGALLHVLQQQQQQQQRQQQQWPVKPVLQLLPLLAAAAPCLAHHTHDEDARTVAAVVRGDASGLMRGAAAMAPLPGAIVAALAAPRALSQSSSAAAAAAADAGSQLQQQQRQREVLLWRAEPAQALAALWAALSLRSQQHVRLLRDALTLLKHVVLGGRPRPAEEEQSSAVAVHTWPLHALHTLLELLFEYEAADTASDTHSQCVWDASVAATAQHVHALAQQLHAFAKSGGSSSSSSGGRGSAKAAARRSAPVALHNLHMVCDIAHLVYRHNQYHPALQAALSELLVGVDAAQRHSRTPLLLPHMLSSCAATLAGMGGCTPAAVAALQHRVAAAAAKCSAPRLILLMWAMAVLDVRDEAVWAALRGALTARLPQAQAQQQQRQRQQPPQRCAAADAEGLLDGSESAEDAGQLRDAEQEEGEAGSTFSQVRDRVAAACPERCVLPACTCSRAPPPPTHTQTHTRARVTTLTPPAPPVVVVLCCASNASRAVRRPGCLRCTKQTASTASAWPPASRCCRAGWPPARSRCMSSRRRTP
jgi:hypothetical protein